MFKETVLSDLKQQVLTAVTLSVFSLGLTFDFRHKLHPRMETNKSGSERTE